MRARARAPDRWYRELIAHEIDCERERAETVREGREGPRRRQKPAVAAGETRGKNGSDAPLSPR